MTRLLMCALALLACCGCGTLTVEGWQSSEYARTKRIEAKLDSLRAEVRALREQPVVRFVVPQSLPSRSDSTVVPYVQVRVR